MILEDLIERYPNLNGCQDTIKSVYNSLLKCFESDGRLYICGNGGSASDALHIVGELVKSFVVKRKLDSDFLNKANEEMIKNLQGALPAFALVENVALATAYGNDVNPDYIFAQQVYAYVKKGDCVMGISTSGNSKNVLHALECAKFKGAITLGLTGRDGGKMKNLCDSCIIVPENETYKIQELHLPIYHALCMMLEKKIWSE